MITFVGWYGRQNGGDEAFKDVHRLIFPDQPLEWVDDRVAPDPKVERQWVLGGGDVINEFYIKRIPDEAPFVIYGCGIGGEAEFAVMERHAHRIKAAWVRNAKDAERLREMGINARFTPDIVFQLKRWAIDQKPADPAGPVNRKRLVVFPSANAAQAASRTGDLRNYLYYEFFKRELALVCDFLADYYDIVFYPLSTNVNDNDRLFAEEVASHMKEKRRAIVMPGEDPIPEVIELVRNAELVLSMKFHGNIFSVLAETAFVNIGLSRKTQYLCLDNGLPELSIAPYQFSFDSLVRSVRAAEDPKTLAKIRSISDQLFEQASAEGAAFRSLLRDLRT